MGEEYYFFWQGPLSQWHPSTFTLGSQTYNCAEQYMMHSKALLFSDEKAAQRIMTTSDPQKQKAIGQQVGGFDDAVWCMHREKIVYAGSLAKFSQNKGLRRKLFQTDHALLVEASPLDAIWGAGLSEAQARAIDPSQWPGANLLGKILTRVRDDLRQQFSGEHTESLQTKANASTVKD